MSGAATWVVVALGSNLGDSRLIIERAMAQLEQFSEQPILRSSLWESTPVDCPPGSPRFVNAVVAFQPLPDEFPELLLATLQELEKQFGRMAKKVLNEPRPLDLDLISYGDEVRTSAELTLPHPRARERLFVMQPLAEILPELKFPGDARSVKELLHLLPPDETFLRMEK